MRTKTWRPPPFPHPVWDGCVCSTLMSWEWSSSRRRLFDAAEGGDWDGLFELLADSQEKTLNFVRPDDRSWYSFLHHAVLGNAPKEVIEEFLSLGHFRGLRCAAGERPVDLARRLGYSHLIPLLDPLDKHEVPEKDLAAFETQFHELILKTDFPSQVEPTALRLPPLDLLLEQDEPVMTFLIPKMFGGYDYRLEQLTLPPHERRWILMSRSFCRILDGEELNRYLVTTFGSVMITKDFEEGLPPYSLSPTSAGKGSTQPDRLARGGCLRGNLLLEDRRSRTCRSSIPVRGHLAMVGRHRHGPLLGHLLGTSPRGPA